MEEAAERIRSHTSLLQLTQEKQQMELSHKRARIELEKEANSSSRDLQVSDGLSTHSHHPYNRRTFFHYSWHLLRQASMLVLLRQKFKQTPNLILATAWQCVHVLHERSQ